MLVGAAVWAVHPGNPGFRKGSAITTFSQTLTLVAGLLCLGKRVSYRRLRKEFGLDDETLEDVRHELIVMRLAVDEGGQGLAFVGTAPFETGNAPPASVWPIEMPIISVCQPSMRRGSRTPCFPVILLHGRLLQRQFDTVTLAHLGFGRGPQDTLDHTAQG